MDPKTKREAEELALIADVRAFRDESWIDYGGLPGEATPDELRTRSAQWRAEATRLRALATALPE